MFDKPTSPLSPVAHELLAYLGEYPEAQDTLEGIVEWWLLEREITKQTAAVQEALAELVMRNLVLERKGGDERIHYRLNRQRQDEITALRRHRSQ
jgi:hypothetical protein